MKHKKLLIVVVLVILLLLFLRFFTGTTVLVDGSEADSISWVAVFVDGKPVLNRNESTKIFTIPNLRGPKTIIVRRAGYRDAEVKVSAFWKSTKTIHPHFEELEASELAESLDSGLDTSNTLIKDAAYFDNRTWLAYRLASSTDDSIHPASIIARYVQAKQNWEVLNFGSENELEPEGNGFTIPKEIVDGYIKQ